jgi:two-component system, OmpR family, KDP operon response regulator KdpE
MKKLGARILVVDEEREILRLLQRAFTAHEYQVFTMTSSVDTLEALVQYRPDLLLLSLDGSGSSGLEICQRVRAQSSLPLIVLSGNERECDKVRALDLGADDYVCKPFGIQELLARVRVALRHIARLSSGTKPLITAGPLSIDVARRLVQVHGQEVQFTPTEYDLLKVFITHRDKILSRQLLLSQVWGIAYESDIHCLHVYIAQLRHKIEVDPSRPRLIVNVPGVGYRFICEQDQSA